MNEQLWAKHNVKFHFQKTFNKRETVFDRLKSCDFTNRETNVKVANLNVNSHKMRKMGLCDSREDNRGRGTATMVIFLNRKFTAEKHR